MSVLTVGNIKEINVNPVSNNKFLIIGNSVYQFCRIGMIRILTLLRKNKNNYYYYTTDFFIVRQVL